MKISFIFNLQLAIILRSKPWVLRFTHTSKWVWCNSYDLIRNN